MESIPEYLYKVISKENWIATQKEAVVVLSSEDDAFIHFCTEEQLDRILKKYWADKHSVVILKIKVDCLIGSLIQEKNPGGSIKYFHLYEGSIPKSSIVETQVLVKN